MMRHSGFMQVVEQIPDQYKALAVVPTSVLTLFGFPLEQWVFVLTAVLTIIFIIEKLPKAFMSIKWMWNKIKGKKNKNGKVE